MSLIGSYIMNKHKTNKPKGMQDKQYTKYDTILTNNIKHKKHCSFGIIPYCVTGSSDTWVLLVQHRHGHHWGFPKGYSKNKESPLRTATREFNEETGLSKQVFMQRPHKKWKIIQRYTCLKRGQKITKIVSLFPTCLDISRVPRNFNPSNEIISCRWFLLSDAFYVLTHRESKDALMRFVHDLYESKKISQCLR